MTRGVEIFRSANWGEAEALRDRLAQAGITVVLYEITAGVTRAVVERGAVHAQWSLRADPAEAERAFRYLAMAEYHEPDAYEDDLEQPVLRRRPFFRYVAAVVAAVFLFTSLWWALR